MIGDFKRKYAKMDQYELKMAYDAIISELKDAHIPEGIDNKREELEYVSVLLGFRVSRAGSDETGNV